MLAKNEKLYYKLRENRGRQIKKEFTQAFFEKSGILLDDLQFLDLRKTDLLRNKFIEMFDQKNPKNSITIKTYAMRDMVEKLKPLFLRIQNSELIVFLHHSYELGAIRINANDVYKNLENLLEFDGDTIQVLSEDLANAFDLDFYEISSFFGTNWIYEATILGESWSTISTS